MYVTKIDCDRDFAHFLYTFLCFEFALTSKDIMAAFVNILGVHIIHENFFECTKIHSNMNKNAADFWQFRTIFAQNFAF